MAVSVVFCPMQMVSSGETEIAGSGFTVTVVCDVAVHPFAEVPVTIYVVVEVGCAVTLEPVDEFNDAEGLHE